MNPEEIKSGWSRWVYPCSEGCGYIGPLDAFTWGQSYEACPQCGADKHQRTGRFVYRVKRSRWLPFIKRKIFVRVEWRDEK